jgi:aryl-alcohol dehydrogenase-like predicted oxidoreductase
VYADGEAEAVLGTLLDAMVDRDELTIIAKAGLRARAGRRHDGSRGHLLKTLDTTLRRLGVSHVDIWMIHGWDAGTPMEETLATVDHAVASGRVRYAGVSNFSAWQTARAATWQQGWPGRAPIVATEMEYSLLQRGIEREVIPACEEVGIGVLPWSPLGRGVLTGKYRHDRPADSRAEKPHFERFVLPYLQPRCSAIVESLATAAQGLGITPSETALAWVRDRPGVTAPIIGARTTAQLMTALRIEEFTLPQEIAQALDDVSAISVGYPEREA